MQERNRPIEPPTKPAAAPFFLPTIPGLEGNPVFATEADAEQNAGQAAYNKQPCTGIAGPFWQGSDCFCCMCPPRIHCQVTLSLQGQSYPGVSSGVSAFE